MVSRIPTEPEFDLQDLMADPMIRLIMQADGIDEREVRELCDRAAVDIRRPAAPGTLQSSSSPDDMATGFRRGVGIVLVNVAGQVLAGQRSDVSRAAWQMPQGGIEPDETPLAAALRELREETGTSNVDIVIGTEGWLSYELPADLLARIPNARWKGQTQQWFLMRFLGRDDEINVATEHPEFSKWRWIAPDRLLKLIVPFKRDLYRRVLIEFQPHLAKASFR